MKITITIPIKFYNLKVDNIIRKVELMDVKELRPKKSGYLGYIRKYQNNKNVSREDKIKLAKLLHILQIKLKFGIRPIIHS